MVGKSLGPYEILEQLGAGGMGEVWLAQDTRLGRKVAIKVLPQEFAGMPERLARFEQEARAAAALNHPHIAVVHDVGHAQGLHFMVQEHLEGHTLRATIAKGRPPLSQALKLAGEICEALAAAHAAGIVHRDLKPENLFVTEEGHAKVLDFGLAKLTEVAMSGSPGSASISPTMLGTVAGQIMGTAGYMAPEQVQGEQVDHRADLFAFGCVLYELTAGTQAFRGKNMIETLNQVTNVEPDGLVSVDGSLPAELQRILDKALAKGRKRRYQSAGDLAVDLQTLAAAVESGTAMPIAIEAAESARGGGPSWAAAAGLAIGALLLGLAAAWMVQPAAEPAPLVHFTFDPVDDSVFFQADRRVIDMSRDGRSIAFSDEGAIWLRSVGDPELVQVRGSDGASSPRFSPDGEWLAFWSDGQLRKVPVAGGAPLALAECLEPVGVSWEPDGSILLGQGSGGILRVSENGGEPQALFEGDETERYASPSLLPGGEWVLFAVRNSGERWDNARLVVQSLITGERRLVVSGGREPRYLAAGHVTFVRDGALFAVPFDGEAMEVTGGAVPLIVGVQETTGNRTGGAYYAFSATGDLTYISGFAGTSRGVRLAYQSLEGDSEILPFEAQPFDSPRVSPDGGRIAVDVPGGSDVRAIWIYDLARGTRQRLTSGEQVATDAIWSPDGQWVYFASSSDGQAGIVRRRADHTGSADFVGGDGTYLPADVSPDGNQVAFYLQGNLDIGILDVETGESEMVVASDAIEALPRFSPDGRFLAYVSNEGDGTFRTYVRDLESGERHVVSPESGSYPMWDPAGGRLYYYDRSTALMMYVEVSIGERLQLGPPQRLFETRLPGPFPLNDMDITPDGKHFLMMTEQESVAEEQDSEPVRLHVLLNWAAELQRRVPGR